MSAPPSNTNHRSIMEFWKRKVAENDPRASVTKTMNDTCTTMSSTTCSNTSEFRDDNINNNTSKSLRSDSFVSAQESAPTFLSGLVSLAEEESDASTDHHRHLDDMENMLPPQDDNASVNSVAAPEGPNGDDESTVVPPLLEQCRGRYGSPVCFDDSIDDSTMPPPSLHLPPRLPFCPNNQDHTTVSSTELRIQAVLEAAAEAEESVSVCNSSTEDMITAVLDDASIQDQKMAAAPLKDDNSNVDSSDKKQVAFLDVSQDKEADEAVDGVNASFMSNNTDVFLANVLNAADCAIKEADEKDREDEEIVDEPQFQSVESENETGIQVTTKLEKPRRVEMYEKVRERLARSSTTTTSPLRTANNQKLYMSPHASPKRPRGTPPRRYNTDRQAPGRTNSEGDSKPEEVGSVGSSSNNRRSASFDNSSEASSNNFGSSKHSKNVSFDSSVASSVVSSTHNKNATFDSSVASFVASTKLSKNASFDSSVASSVVGSKHSKNASFDSSVASSVVSSRCGKNATFDGSLASSVVSSKHGKNHSFDSGSKRSNHASFDSSIASSKKKEGNQMLRQSRTDLERKPALAPFSSRKIHSFDNSVASSKKETNSTGDSKPNLAPISFKNIRKDSFDRMSGYRKRSNQHRKPVLFVPNETLDNGSVSTNGNNGSTIVLEDFFDAFLDFLGPDDDASLATFDSGTTMDDTRTSVSHDTSWRSSDFSLRRHMASRRSKKDQNTFAELKAWFQRELKTDRAHKIEELGQEIKKAFSAESMEHLFPHRDDSEKEETKSKSNGPSWMEFMAGAILGSDTSWSVAGTEVNSMPSESRPPSTVCDQSLDTLDDLVQELRKPEAERDPRKSIDMSTKVQKLYESLKKGLDENLDSATNGAELDNALQVIQNAIDPTALTTIQETSADESGSNNWSNMHHSGELGIKGISPSKSFARDAPGVTLTDVPVFPRQLPSFKTPDSSLIVDPTTETALSPIRTVDLPQEGTLEATCPKVSLFDQLNDLSLMSDPEESVASSASLQRKVDPPESSKQPEIRLDDVQHRDVSFRNSPLKITPEKVNATKDTEMSQSSVLGDFSDEIKTTPADKFPTALSAKGDILLSDLHDGYLFRTSPMKVTPSKNQAANAVFPDFADSSLLEDSLEGSGRNPSQTSDPPSTPSIGTGTRSRGLKISVTTLSGTGQLGSEQPAAEPSVGSKQERKESKFEFPLDFDKWYPKKKDKNASPIKATELSGDSNLTGLGQEWEYSDTRNASFSSSASHRTASSAGPSTIATPTKKKDSTSLNQSFSSVSSRNSGTSRGSHAYSTPRKGLRGSPGVLSRLGGSLRYLTERLPKHRSPSARSYIDSDIAVNSEEDDEKIVFTTLVNETLSASYDLPEFLDDSNETPKKCSAAPTYRTPKKYPTTPFKVGRDSSTPGWRLEESMITRSGRALPLPDTPPRSPERESPLSTEITWSGKRYSPLRKDSNDFAPESPRERPKSKVQAFLRAKSLKSVSKHMPLSDHEDTDRSSSNEGSVDLSGPPSIARSTGTEPKRFSRMQSESALGQRPKRFSLNTFRQNKSYKHRHGQKVSHDIGPVSESKVFSSNVNNWEDFTSNSFAPEFWNR